MNSKLIITIITSLVFLISCNDSPKKKSTEIEVNKKEVKTTSVKEIDKTKVAKYTELGMSIAKNTGKTLKGRLKAAVNKGGLESGIKVCNIEAQKLMDSMSVVYSVKIKRTSMKIRNTDDAPNQFELAVLSDFHKKHNKGEKVKPVVKENNGMMSFYAPIFIEDVCLNCHGVIGEKMKPATNDIIKSLYAKDEAINYKKGDLRAIWSITFNK